VIRRTLCAVALALLAACTSGRTAHAPSAPLLIGVTQEPQSLNPLLLQGAMSALVGPTVYSSLLVADSRGELAPDLATAVPSLANGGISRDGLTITYHLRRRVTWQDGAPLTASDVVFTFGQVVNPKNDVQSRTGYDQVAKVQAVDAQTVRVRLRRRYSAVLANFFGPDQNYQILPRHLLARYADLNRVPFNSTPVGSGPYRVQEWKRGEELVLSANPRYFRGKPPIAQIRLRFIPDNNTLLEQLRTGEVNVQFDADPAYLHQYQSLRGMNVTRTPINGTQMLLFNTADPVMHDVRVRRAIAEALDIPRLVHDATRGGESADAPGRGFFSWPYNASIAPPKYDANDARRLLDAAGVKRPLTVRLVLQSGLPEAEQMALSIQQQLRRLGIAVTLRTYSPVQYAAPAASGGPLFGGTFQIALLQILSGIDPSTEYFFGCAELPPRGFNLTRYCNPRIQAALDADAQTYDPAARRRYSEVVQREVARDVPFVPLWRRRSIAVFPSWLHGIDPSPTSAYWNVWEWSSR
jgi:peptide/nickel transport system substrate-binding protein